MRYVVPIVPALEVSQLPPLHLYLLDERTYNSLFLACLCSCVKMMCLSLLTALLSHSFLI